MSRSSKSKGDWERRVAAARRLHQEANSLNDSGQTLAAYRKVIRSIAVWRQLQCGYPKDTSIRDGTATALHLAGVIAWRADLYDNGVTHLTDALREYRNHFFQSSRFHLEAKAQVLNTLIDLLTTLGCNQQALLFGRQRIHVYRRLATFDHDNNKHHVAYALGAQARLLAIMGRSKDAITHSRNALTIYVSLSRETPGVRLSDTITEAKFICNHLVVTKRFKSAQRAAAHAATSICRGASRSSLNNVGIYVCNLRRLYTLLAGLGCITPALSIARQMVRTASRFQTINEDAYLDYMADAHSCLAHALMLNGHFVKAIKSAKCVTAYLGQLNARQPRVYDKQIAQSLITVGSLLIGVGHVHEAIEAAHKALTLAREYASEGYWSGLLLARVLTLYGRCLACGKSYESAACLMQEALTEYGKYISKGDKYKIESISVRTELADMLSRCGKGADAVECIQSVFFHSGNVTDETPPFVIVHVDADVKYRLACINAILGKTSEAVVLAREALALYAAVTRFRPTCVVNVARCLNVLGAGLHEIGQRDEAEQALNKALKACRSAGSSSRREYYDCAIESLRLLATSAFCADERKSARSYLSRAGELISRGVVRFTHPTDRDLFIRTVSECLELRIRVALRSWEVEQRIAYLREALQAAEMARSRHLLELMGDAERLPNASNLTKRAWLKHLRAVRQAEWRLDALERRSTSVPDDTLGVRHSPPPWANERFTIISADKESAEPIPSDSRELRKAQAELRTAKAGLDRLLTEIRREDPDFEPFLPVRPLSARDQLVMLGAPAAKLWCVSWLVSEERTLAFVLAPGVQPVGLDLGEAGSKSLIKQAAAGLDWKRGPEQAALRRVAELILWPVLKRLPREAWDRLPQHVILVPKGILQTLPLQALPLPEELGGGCLGDRFAISLTPSLSLAHRLARHAPKQCRRALAVVNPESFWREGFLAFGALEGLAFQEHHRDSKVCLGRRATAKGFFQAAASGPGLVHVSAHMGSDPKAPLESGIRLHDRRLPLREIYGKLKMDGTWLTILNGCQSGVIGEAAAGNPEGLPLGFLFGGSTNVISTLHTVYDVSSALLLDRFYQELRPGVSVSMALKHASDWLRGHRTEAVPDALVDGPAAARAIRAFTARARAFRGKPRLTKSWREIFRHCADKAREVQPSCHPPFDTLQHWAAHIALGASWLPTPPARRPRTRPATASRTA